MPYGFLVDLRKAKIFTKGDRSIEDTFANRHPRKYLGYPYREVYIKEYLFS